MIKSQTRVDPILEKSWSNLKILGARRVAWDRLHTKGPQNQATLYKILSNSVALTTCRQGIYLKLYVISSAVPGFSCNPVLNKSLYSVSSIPWTAVQQSRCDSWRTWMCLCNCWLYKCICEAEDSKTLPKHPVVISQKYTRRLYLSLKMVIVIVSTITSVSARF